MIPEDDSFVAPEHGCPGCGERHTDQLRWLDDDRVECLLCGMVYTPATPEPKSGR